MMSLVISACLSASPAQCELVEIGSSYVEGLKACRIQMQQTVDMWQAAHPDRIVRTSWCAVGRSEGQT